ncbi:hypothetical protein N9089_02585 [Crocinitomicaceae bacterium]|nr:hypothetical protein [Crocinitomicaceae bacterium]
MESNIKKIYDKAPVVIQNLGVSAFSFLLDRERYRGRFKEYQDFLEQSQWYNLSQQDTYQNDKLQKLLSYAYNRVPYYRKIMDERKLLPVDIRSIADLHKLPVLTKDDIRRNFSELLSADYKYKTVRKGHTSGTTGTPLEVCYSNDMIQMNYALLDRQYRWADARLGKFGDRVAVIRGNVIVPLQQKKPPFWRHNYVYRQLLLSAFHLSTENLHFYIDEIKRFRPKILDGYPSTLYVIAKYLKNNNEKLKLHAVISASETLFDFQREIIEESFDCRMFDYFASAERVLFATECDKHMGHHISSEYGVTEVLGSNQEPAGEGEEGTLVATSLHNYAMPLIRYVTNDRTALKAIPCTCGRDLPLMEDVTTKAEDLITLKDGRLISPSVLTHPFKPLVGITESQIIQERPDYIRVLIVPGKEFSREDGWQLVRGLEERLGEGVEVDIEIVDRLERKGSGKFKWVISNVDVGI